MSQVSITPFKTSRPRGARARDTATSEAKPGRSEGAASLAVLTAQNPDNESSFTPVKTARPRGAGQRDAVTSEADPLFHARGSEAQPR